MAAAMLGLLLLAVVAVIVARPLTLTDREAGICKTYRDIGGDPDPFTAGVIAGCTLATSDRACDDGFGFGYLDASRRGATNLCKSGGTASFTSHPDAGHCGGAEPAHVLDLRNVAVRFNPRSSNVELKFQCGANELDKVPRNGDPAYVGRYADFIAQEDPVECTEWVEEPTILVQDPRPEYLSNMYHATEELLAVFQTAAIAGLSLSSGTRILYTYSHDCPRDAEHCRPRRTMMQLQLGAQLEGEYTRPEVPHIRDQILDLYNSIVQYGPKMKPLPDITEIRRICFRRIILPHRACSGSILPKAWENVGDCPAGNPIFEAVSRTLRLSTKVTDEASGSASAGAAAGVIGPPPGVEANLDANTPRLNIAGLAEDKKQVTIFSRRGSSRHIGREKQLVGDITKKCGHTVVMAHLGSMTWHEQIIMLERTDVLVSPHGAGLALMMFLPRGATVVEISSHPPPWPGRSVANIYKLMALWAGLPYHGVRASGQSELEFDYGQVASIACNAWAR